MMLLFAVAFFGTVTVALWRGGRPERATAAAVAIAAFISPFVERSTYAQPEIGLLIVDAGLAVFLFGVALTSDRFWPLWAAAAQGIGTVTHFVREMLPSMFDWVYATSVIFWSYPVLAALLVGTLAECPYRSRSGDERSGAARGTRV